MPTISYGGYVFESPLPFVAMDENLIKLSGSVDHGVYSISLIGQLTGCSLTAIKIKKDELVHAFSSGFQDLVIGSTGYSCVKPLAINFESSDLRRNLPYEIQLEAYSEKDFSQFYGISEPKDYWEFSEGDNRIVQARHIVSANGLKTDTGDSLAKARDFVDSRLNGFDNLSLFFTGETTILTSREEAINRLSNSYGITEVYDLSTSESNLDGTGSIVRADCSINFSQDSDLSVSVNGSIKGGLNNQVSTGQFTPNDAKNFAKNAILRAKTPYEDSLYGDILKAPATYNYNVNTGANSIDFSFSFVDPSDSRTGEVIHDYQTDINASKDNGFVSVNINGSVKYNSTNDIFITAEPETETRYKKVEAFFSGVDPFTICQQHFIWFNEFDSPYSELPLDDSYREFNISKTPHESLIGYNYTYDNRPDMFSGLFKNVDLTIQTDHPIDVYSAQPTTDGDFSVQELYSSLERKSVSFNAVLNTGVNIDAALSYVQNWIGQYSGQAGMILSDNITTGSSRISINRQFALE